MRFVNSVLTSKAIGTSDCAEITYLSNNFDRQDFREIVLTNDIGILYNIGKKMFVKANIPC